MSKYTDYNFILWGSRFEEVTATIFTSELRKAGLRVKVVGLTPQLSGAYGLTLRPDLTLDEALPLAAEARSVIIPCKTPGIIRLKNDPRLQKLFRQARANKAKFVFESLNGSDLVDLELDTIPADDIFVCPDSEQLVTFAREIAEILLAV